MQKIAVAIIHGIGRPDKNFADGITAEIRGRFAGELPNFSFAQDALVIKPVYWAPAIQSSEDELWKRIQKGGTMDFVKLRRFMIDFAADAIAYQPTPHDRKIYDKIHSYVAQTLKVLAAEAGPEAPLCVIAHSLGTVVASNFIYDLQVDARKKIIPKSVRAKMGKSPLEKGETLAQFYTLGSPIALWSLRYSDFGKPVDIPSSKFAAHYPGVKGEWLNFYDEDDIIGYPLKTINEHYFKAVTEDRNVNIGGILTSWNPASHVDYWEDDNVTVPIARSLANLFKACNAA